MINNEMHMRANEGRTHLAIDFDNIKDILDFYAHSSHETDSNSTSSRILKQHRPKLHKMITQEPVKLLEPMIDDHVTIKRQQFQEAEEVDYEAVHVRRFHCYICGKKFIRFSHLKCHLHIHTKNKPYSCKISQQQFSKSDYKSIYIQHHLNNKVHHCHICHKMHLDVVRFADHSSWHSDRYYRGIAMGDTARARQGNIGRQMQITEDGIPFSTVFEQLELVSCVAIEKLDNSIDAGNASIASIPPNCNDMTSLSASFS